MFKKTYPTQRLIESLSSFPSKGLAFRPGQSASRTVGAGSPERRFRTPRVVFGILFLSALPCDFVSHGLQADAGARVACLRLGFPAHGRSWLLVSWSASWGEGTLGRSHLWETVGLCLGPRASEGVASAEGPGRYWVRAPPALPNGHRLLLGAFGLPSAPFGRLAPLPPPRSGVGSFPYSPVAQRCCRDNILVRPGRFEMRGRALMQPTAFLVFLKTFYLFLNPPNAFLSKESYTDAILPRTLVTI